MRLPFADWTLKSTELLVLTTKLRREFVFVNRVQISLQHSSMLGSERFKISFGYASHCEGLPVVRLREASDFDLKYGFTLLYKGNGRLTSMTGEILYKS